MAEPLPPLQPMPSTGISPDMIGQLEHSAEWASTFGGSDTNIAQRARHNQDLTAYADSLAQQRSDAQDRLIQTNKTAQKLWIAQQRMDLQQKEAQAKIDNAAELQPLRVKLKEAQIAGDAAHEHAITQADTFKAEAARQQAVDTATFHSAINDALSKGVRIGTPEYTDVVARARLQAPAMRSDVFDDAWKTTASHLTPEEVIANAITKEKGISEARAAARAPAAEIASLEKERALHEQALGRAKRIRSKATDANVIADSDADIIESQKALADVESQIRTRRTQPAVTGAPAPTAPTAPAVAPSLIKINPATGEKITLKDGKWVPLP